MEWLLRRESSVESNHFGLNLSCHQRMQRISNNYQFIQHRIHFSRQTISRSLSTFNSVTDPEQRQGRMTCSILSYEIIWLNLRSETFLRWTNDQNCLERLRREHSSSREETSTPDWAHLLGNVRFKSIGSSAFPVTRQLLWQGMHVKDFSMDCFAWR